MASEVVDVEFPVEKLHYDSSLPGLRRKHVVLVLAGSFNPPTFMHLRMLELAKDALEGDGYFVMGAYLSPVNDAYGKMDLVKGEHRVRMCQLAVADSSFIMVDPWEASQASYQRTLTVLGHIEQSVYATSMPLDQDPAQVVLVCGADVLQSFTIPGVWIPEQVHDICTKHGVICISRADSNIRRLVFENNVLYRSKKGIRMVDEWVRNDISSTHIRRCLARGLSVKYLLPNSVIEYISKHNLYTDLSLRS